MNNSRISVLVALAITLGFVLPACADEPCEMLKNTAMLPVKTLGLGAGLVLGTPVAVLRRSYTRTIDLTNDMADTLGGKDKIPAVVCASVFGVPFGLMAGTSEGLYFGAKNAISHGTEQPFSKESFSLGDLEEGNDAPAAAPVKTKAAAPAKKSTTTTTTTTTTSTKAKTSTR